VATCLLLTILKYFNIINLQLISVKKNIIANLIFDKSLHCVSTCFFSYTVTFITKVPKIIQESYNNSHLFEFHSTWYLDYDITCLKM